MLYRIIAILFVFIPISQGLYAQDTLQYKWTVTSKKLSDKKFEIRFTSNGHPDFKLYAPGQNIDDFKTADLAFSDSSIRLVSFSVESPATPISSIAFTGKNIQATKGPVSWKAEIECTGDVPAQLIGTLGVYFETADEFKQDLPIEFNTVLEGGVSQAEDIQGKPIDINNPAASCGDDFSEKKSIWKIFLLGFLGGLIALITPCVFPLIPVTVTFFTKKSTNRKTGLRNAVMYGFFIFLIYILITLPFHIAGSAISPEIFNNISTNVWLNLAFFVVFIVFALSFFGLFEIGLPSSIANKADSKSGLGNIGGIFFMAGTLAIVSFSCTGPILGTLLANVANEGPWPLTAGAAGFGLALGLPFALFAMFPNWLQSLPKSGGWMTDVKVVLGFVEIALAIKFLANADNVEQWGIIKREVFFALWILCGLGIVLYLLGWLKIGHSSPIKKFSKTRIAFILLFGAFTIYLIPGITNTRWANLKLLSGFPPPISYTIYKQHVLLTEKMKPIHNDYKKALQMAREQNKPLLIDFTGWACANCRRMEENVWVDKAVDSVMRNHFIVLSLYVDEKTKLPTSEQTVYTDSSGNKREIIRVGDKWSVFQSLYFKAVAQPQYAILSPDEKALTKTKFYTPNSIEFLDWLNCGIRAFNKK